MVFGVTPRASIPDTAVWRRPCIENGLDPDGAHELPEALRYLVGVEGAPVGVGEDEALAVSAQAHGLGMGDLPALDGPEPIDEHLGYAHGPPAFLGPWAEQDESAAGYPVGPGDHLNLVSVQVGLRPPQTQVQATP